MHRPRIPPASTSVLGDGMVLTAPVPSLLPAIMAAMAAAALMAGCGGDASWCFNDGSGRVSAGYNTTQCPPDPAGQKQQTPQDMPGSLQDEAQGSGHDTPPLQQGN